MSCSMFLHVVQTSKEDVQHSRDLMNKYDLDCNLETGEYFVTNQEAFLNGEWTPRAFMHDHVWRRKVQEQVPDGIFCKDPSWVRTVRVGNVDYDRVYSGPRLCMFDDNELDWSTWINSSFPDQFQALTSSLFENLSTIMTRIRDEYGPEYASSIEEADEFFRDWKGHEVYRMWGKHYQGRSSMMDSRKWYCGKIL